MVPALYVFLDALPVSANGKVDRNALPPPDGERPDLSSHYVAPRNELERTIANIWIEVLERDRIGILDDFFELGGESLAAIRVVARIHNALGVHIPVRLIFEYPTISGLAQSLA
jgi:acyl carrier protein